MKKGTKIAIGVGVGLLIGISTLIAAGFVLVLLFFFGGPPKTIKNIEKYEATLSEYTTKENGRLRTSFITFPDTIPESAFLGDEKPDFYFNYQDTWDDPTCEVYLKCKYSEADYKSEIERLESVTKTFKDYEGQAKTLIYEDSDRFIHPVYLAIDHHDYSYEYAMDLGDNSIVYIYTAYKWKLNKIKKIPKEYLPKDFEESLDSENGSYWAEGNYDIYEVPNYNNPTHIGQRNFE